MLGRGNHTDARYIALLELMALLVPSQVWLREMQKRHGIGIWVGRCAASSVWGAYCIHVYDLT